MNGFNFYYDLNFSDCAQSQTTDTESTSQRSPRLLSAETVEVFAKDFRDDNVIELEKAANDDTFLANRFGNKNAYMFFSLRIFYDNAIYGRTRSNSSSTSSINAIESNEDGNKSSPLSPS